MSEYNNNSYIPYGDYNIPNSQFTGDVGYGDVEGDYYPQVGDAWEIGDAKSQQLQRATIPTQPVNRPLTDRRGILTNNRNPAISTRGPSIINTSGESFGSLVRDNTPVPFLACANGRIESSELDRGAYFQFGFLRQACTELGYKTHHDPIIKNVTAVGGGGNISVDINFAASDLKALYTTALYVPMICIKVSAPVLNNVVAQPIEVNINAEGMTYGQPAGSASDYGPIIMSLLDLNRPLELIFCGWKIVQSKPRYQVFGIDNDRGIHIKVSNLPQNATVTAIVPGSTHPMVMGVLKSAGMI